MYQFLPISTIEAVLKSPLYFAPGLIAAYVIAKVLRFGDKPIPIKKPVITLGSLLLLAIAALLFFPNPSQTYKMLSNDVVMVQSGSSNWPFQG